MNKYRNLEQDHMTRGGESQYYQIQWQLPLTVQHSEEVGLFYWFLPTII